MVALYGFPLGIDTGLSRSATFSCEYSTGASSKQELRSRQIVQYLGCWSF